MEFAIHDDIVRPVMFAPDEIVEKARSEYGRTIQEVLSREPQEDLYSIIGAVEVLIGSKIKKGLPTSCRERMVFAFVWLAREVQNGGFHQYFFNSAGDYWKDVLEGLKNIGDEGGTAAFQNVLSIFPESSPSAERFDRQAQLNKLSEVDEERVWDHFNIVTNLYFRTPFPNWGKVFGDLKAHTEDFDLRNA
jgi:hypothetical protein